MSETTYFAAASEKEIGSRLMERVEAHRSALKTSGRAMLIRKAQAMLLGAHLESGSVSWRITEGGEQGETLQVAENQFASIGRNVVNRITAQRPAVQLGATNTDKRSLAQTMIAEGLTEFHLSEQKLEQLLQRAARRAWFTSEGWVEWSWSVYDGDDWMPEPDALLASMDPAEAAEPQPVPVLKKGEPKFWCLGPLDVIRDEYAPDLASCNWFISIKWVSKYDLAAKFPEKAGAILSVETKDTREFRLTLGRREASTDLVPFYTFYHRKTPAVPDGRLVELLSDSAVLFDGPLAYDDIPLEPIAPEWMDESPYGWTPMFDLMGPQDAVNALESSIVTNQLGRGMGNLVTDDDSDVSVEDLGGSMNLIKKKRGSELAPLEWPETPRELFAFKSEKIASMEVLAGTNSVLRGNPSANIGADSSGAKLALISETSAINTSGFEKSWVDLIRQVVLRGIIRLYRDFGGNVPRLARIAGKANNYLLKEFTAEDLTDIDRVKVDVGNPIMRTTAGKMAVADKAVELGIIKPGQLDKYIHLLKEGTVEPMLEVAQATLMRIRGENERLMEGGQHNALLTDPHWEEIPEHLSLLDNPALREPSPENQQIQSAILAAVQQHMDLFRAMPPELVMMRGGPEAFAMWQQMMGVMAPMGPPGAPPPGPGGPPPGPDAEVPMNPEASQPGMPGLPSMPRSPLSGEPADPLAGGLPGVAA